LIFSDKKTLYPGVTTGFFVALKVAIFFKATQLQKLFSHNFVTMFLERTHIKKIVSTIFLILLLFVHSVKLLHTHSYNTFFTRSAGNETIFNKSYISDVGKHPSDCEICNYQITKDADHLIFVSNSDFNKESVSYTTVFILHRSLPFFSSFESRGPPPMNV
jgi:hypothetical protein